MGGRNRTDPKSEAGTNVVDGIDAWPVVSRTHRPVSVGDHVKPTVTQMGWQHRPNPTEIPVI